MMELAQFIQMTGADIRWRVACHEAGHVVAVCHQRRRWSRVHIIPSDCSWGMVEGVRSPPPGASDDQLMDHLIFLLAGVAAVRMLVPHSLTGGWTDEINAWRCAGRIGHGQRTAALSSARAAADQLCLRYRPAIQALAGVLVQVRELDSRSSRRIVADAMSADARIESQPVHTARGCPCTPVIEEAFDAGG